MTNPLYRVQRLSFDYRLGKEKAPALREISIDIPKGSLLCLSGPSGSGKTTLLNVLGLIEPVFQGRVQFEELSLSEISEPQKNDIRRRKIGFVFQNFHLMPVLSAEENVGYFLARCGLSRAEAAARVRESLEAVGLWEHRLKRPLEMSGGQRQRVAIARALAKHPEVIIADEPTASLDQKTGRGIMETLASFNRDRGVSVIISSHDPMVHSFVRDHLELGDGRITRNTLASGIICKEAA